MNKMVKKFSMQNRWVHKGYCVLLIRAMIFAIVANTRCLIKRYSRNNTTAGGRACLLTVHKTHGKLINAWFGALYMRAVDTLIDIWLRAEFAWSDQLSTRGGSRDKTRVGKRLLKQITYRVAIISGIDSGWNFHVSYAPRLLPPSLKRVRPVLLVHYVTGHIHSGVRAWRIFLD